MAYDANEAKTRIKAVMAAANAATDADNARDLIATAWAGFFTWLIGSLDVKTKDLADTGGYTLLDDTTVE